MKSRPIATGMTGRASQLDSARDDARGGSFLFTHQQLGVLALGTGPSNNQVIPIVINGTTITVTAVTGSPTNPNDVKAPGTAAGFVTNLIQFLRRPDLTTSTQIAASSANQVLLSYVGWAWPGSSTNIVPFSLNKNVNGITGLLTSFNITGITVTSGTWTAQTMQLYVEDGSYYINGTRYLFTGGSTPTVTGPVSNPRIDVLTIDTSGTLAWTTGAENASPVAPTYPANKLPICELYNVVGETALYDNENQQGGQGYISNDVRPTTTAGPNLGAIPDDLIPDAADTRSLGSPSFEWLNIYGKNIYVSGSPAAGAKFGGTGADGALSITTGTTTINLGGAAVVVKNYTSISITGTGNLAFSNPNANGTIVILKSQGNVTITSSATAAIDMTNATGVYVGAAGGSGSAGNGLGAQSGAAAGGGGGSIKNSGSNGSQGTNQSASVSSGNPGNPAVGLFTIPGGQGGQAGANGTGIGSVSPIINLDVVGISTKSIPLIPGSGGGGGCGTSTSSQNGGNGGAGGGVLYIECAGSLNFTGAINASGQNGTSASGSSAGAGAGGGGGEVVVLYNSLTANSGTVNVAGGVSGVTGHAAGIGGAGISLVAKNTEFA
jgi:hypothetical protein